MSKTTANSLIEWYLKNKRDLPWRHTSDPYKIWLSEIILQQTRVEQGLPYYLKFVENFPTVAELAGASDDEIMKLWQGLGYYSRARNLLEAARTITTQYHGEFPRTYEELLSLKGIGNYTASAIGSFAFNLKTPVLDGNVFRFITRLYGIDSPIDLAITRTSVMELLNEWMQSTAKPAALNQALMEFGAMQCKPQKPNCAICPFVHDCYAFKEERISELPVKGKAIKITKRYFHYFAFIKKPNTMYLRKRGAGDVWQGLYEMPMIETSKPIAINQLLRSEEYMKWVSNCRNIDFRSSKTVLHKLTHQHLSVTFYIVNIESPLNLENSSIFDIEINTVNTFAVPKVIETFLHDEQFKQH